KNISESKLARKRNSHLISEKKRRESIKEGMEQLQKIVPSCWNIQGKAVSKSFILRKTNEYLLESSGKNKELQTENRDLQQQKKELQQKAVNLEQENTELRRL